MRAVVCNALGTVDQLVMGDMASPPVGPSEVKVKVKAASLNFPDTLMIAGKYQVKPDLPFSPGGELAGEVIAIGPGVDRFSVGQRVMGVCGYGAFAEEAVVAENRLSPVPDDMSDETAAAFTMVYGTSYHALKQRAMIRPRETMLVMGAGGGVGLAAVELGKVMGAKVVAAASTDDKLEVARAAGADDLVNYAQDDLKGTLKRHYPEGIDVIYDPVGGRLTDAALRNVAWRGRFLVIGFAAGEIPKIPANLALLKGCSIVGVFWGSFVVREPHEHDENMKELVQMFHDGLVHPKITHTFPLDQYEAAFNLLTSRRATGKVVLKIGG